jgi:hypothetical protein
VRSARSQENQSTTGEQKHANQQQLPLHTRVSARRADQAGNFTYFTGDQFRGYDDNRNINHFANLTRHLRHDSHNHGLTLNACDRWHNRRRQEASGLAVCGAPSSPKPHHQEQEPWDQERHGKTSLAITRHS